MTKKGRIYRVLDPKSARSTRVGESQKAARRRDGEPAQRRAGRLARPPGYACPAGGAVRAGRPRRRRVESVRPGRQFHGKDFASNPRRLGPGPGRPDAFATAAAAVNGMHSSPCSLMAMPRCVLRQPKSSARREIPQALELLISLLGDTSPRVRFFAAIALGKLGRAEAAGPALEHDACQRRQATPTCGMRASWVWRGPASLKPGATAAHDTSQMAARMAVLLAMRRFQDPEIAGFLERRDPRLVLEAARAINDVPIVAALPAWPHSADCEHAHAPLLRRVLNANFRLGSSEHAACPGRSGRAVGSARGGARDGA